MIGPFKIKRGDQLPSLAYICTLSDGSIVDLTTAESVKFAMRLGASKAGAAVVDAQAAFVDRLAGSVRYDWGAADLAGKVGFFNGEFQVKFPTGKPMTFPGGEEYIGIVVGEDVAI